MSIHHNICTWITNEAYIIKLHEYESIFFKEHLIKKSYAKGDLLFLSKIKLKLFLFVRILQSPRYINVSKLIRII